MSNTLEMIEMAKQGEPYQPYPSFYEDEDEDENSILKLIQIASEGKPYDMHP